MQDGFYSKKNRYVLAVFRLPRRFTPRNDEYIIYFHIFCKKRSPVVRRLEGFELAGIGSCSSLAPIFIGGGKITLLGPT